MRLWDDDSSPQRLPVGLSGLAILPLSDSHPRVRVGCVCGRGVGHVGYVTVCVVLCVLCCLCVVYMSCVYVWCVYVLCVWCKCGMVFDGRVCVGCMRCVWGAYELCHLVCGVCMTLRLYVCDTASVCACMCVYVYGVLWP